jgi:hypothetical protein
MKVENEERKQLQITGTKRKHGPVQQRKFIQCLETIGLYAAVSVPLSHLSC